MGQRAYSVAPGNEAADYRAKETVSVGALIHKPHCYTGGHQTTSLEIVNSTWDSCRQARKGLTYIRIDRGLHGSGNIL